MSLTRKTENVLMGKFIEPTARQHNAENPDFFRLIVSLLNLNVKRYF